MLGADFVIKNRYQLNDALLNRLKPKNWPRLLFTFILIIATFNIIGALTMLIIEKEEGYKNIVQLGPTGLAASYFYARGIYDYRYWRVVGLCLA